MDRDALVVGESLVDIVRRADGTTTEHPGGSAANVAVALARLDRPVRLATAYAADRHGAMIADHLDGTGVARATDPGAIDRTSTALATIGIDGAATYSFELEWRLNPVPDDPVPLVVHVCSLGAVMEPGAEVVRELLHRWQGVATVTYDINARPAVMGSGKEVVAAVERVAALADLVKCSDEDLEALYPALTLAEAAHALLDLGPPAVVVTRGAAGAFWLGRRALVEIKSQRVDVSDTIGAGDTFAAGLIDALWDRAQQDGHLTSLDRSEVQAILEHAVRAASVTVSRPGADPPWRHELG